MENAFGTQRDPIKGMIFGDPQKLIHIDTILILIYIHTYILTSDRRINIAQLTRDVPYLSPQAGAYFRTRYAV